MIDTKELRKLVHRHAQVALSIPIKPAMLSEILDRLEAAEKERDALRAKIEQMEQQEPYCTAIGPGDWTYRISSPARPGMALYALPGAQGEEEMTNDDLADLVSKAMRRAWQLGQTYWQQADSEYGSQWKKADKTQATFDQLVEDTRAEILVASSGAHPELNPIGFSVDIATDPAVNGGWKLVPTVPTREMRAAWDSSPICEDDDAEFRRAYSEMLAAAPEAK